MGLFSTVLNSLGLRRPLRVREPGPLGLAPGGEARLGSLPETTHILVSATAQDVGWLATVDEAEAPESDFEQLQPRLWVRAADAAHLQGLNLDFEDGRWRVVLDLTVRSRETPNPESRLYLFDRPLHYGRPLYLRRKMNGLPLLGQRLLADPDVVSILLRGNTVTVERKEEVAWDRLDRHVDASVREHLLMGGGMVDGAGRPVRDDPLEEEVVRLLEAEVLPAIHRDGGNMTLQRIQDGVVYVHLEGACASCPASMLTLKGGVERTLKQAFPGEIHKVEAV